MAGTNLDELKALDVQSRLALVQQLWDSIVDDAAAAAQLPLPDELRRELDARLREDETSPEAAIEWSNVRDRLRNGR